MKSRTRARCVALQALYEIDLTGHPPGYVLQQRATDENLDSRMTEFAERIVSGVLPLIKDLDHYISEHAPEWPLNQVAIIDRNILRIALWEFAVKRETPVKVAINEAVDLAKRFGSDSSPRFVNGVLGGLAERLNEIHQAINIGTE
ncbi:MAG: transcription antitermination factor NusB [Anaerolineales bacterium]|nr:transcription antitermination factor NusB [Anaerolineales bacterium]